MAHSAPPSPQPSEEPPADLTSLGAVIAERLRDHFPADTEAVRQVMAVAEEAGEFVGAYRRAARMARRSGEWEDVEAELADLVITAFVTAHVLQIDLDAAIRAKAQTVFTRGWRDTTGPATGAGA